MTRQLTVYDRPGMPAEPLVSGAAIADYHSNTHPLLSSERQDWQTPPWFMDMVKEVIGDDFFDPASAPGNPTEASAFATPNGVHGVGWVDTLHCGLTFPWPTDVPTFINPPYGKHLNGPIDPKKQIKKKGRVVGVGTGWARKIAQHPGEWLCLVPSRTSTPWWQELERVATKALLWGSPELGRRIAFINPETGNEQRGSTLESTVFYHGPSIERFADAFRDHGVLL